jgi:hypothetical protein
MIATSSRSSAGPRPLTPYGLRYTLKDPPSCRATHIFGGSNLFSRKLSLCLGSLVLSLAACSADPNPDGDADGSGGSVGDGGTSAGTGAAPGSGAAPGTGGLGNPGSGGSGGGFGPSDGGAPHAGGAGAAPGVGGTAAGGSGGGGATGGSGGGSGDTGGSENGTGGGGGGGDVGPGPSDIPPAPGPDNVPRPSGTPGNITVIDWAGFPAAVTYSFDDNDGSQLTYYEQMKAIGGRYTFFLVTQNFGVAISDARWKAIYEDGNEIGNHTTNHSCGTSNIDGANTAIQTTFGRAPSTLAAPNGDTSCTGQAPGRVFLNRGVTPASPVKPNDNSNPYQLNCYIPATGQAASAYNSNIDSALSQKGWVIYVIHGINPGTSHTFQPVSWDGLKGAIEYAKSKNVWIDTLENIGAYWLGQKEFAKAMTQTNGASKTWTWTLPDKFPTGKYLRVKVDGGTLIQDGKPLTWDPHGYYEISLDEKSVTLEP